jgi:membrane-bound lytic murein transglycosylase A
LRPRRRRLAARRLVAGLAALTLASCATLPLPPRVGPASLASLPGWEAEDHVAALAAVRRDCSDSPRLASAPVCAAVRALGAPDDPEAKAFLERHFRAEPIEGEGLLTAYFSPAYDARHAPDQDFSAAVRPPPPDPAAAPDRAALDDAPALDALAWMRPEDLFFLQIQGSGVLSFADGQRQRASFAASNGRPFVAIARPMIAQGLLAPSAASADAVRDWLAAHPGPAARAVMDLDPRYIFFRLAPDDGAEPRGAAGAPMLPGRSVAVDPAAHPYFDLLWLDADAPTLTGARSAYRRLVVALDTGAAIKGPARADLYLGRGAAAGAEAARVRHRLRLYRIVAAP